MGYINIDKPNHRPSISIPNITPNIRSTSSSNDLKHGRTVASLIFLPQPRVHELLAQPQQHGVRPQADEGGTEAFIKGQGPLSGQRFSHHIQRAQVVDATWGDPTTSWVYSGPGPSCQKPGWDIGGSPILTRWIQSKHQNLHASSSDIPSHETVIFAGWIPNFHGWWAGKVPNYLEVFMTSIIYIYAICTT